MRLMASHPPWMSFGMKIASRSAGWTHRRSACTPHDDVAMQHTCVPDGRTVVQGLTTSLLQYCTCSSTAPVTHSAVIPLLATNLDFDPENYLSRLVQGWADHPAKHKLVVTGGCDKHLL